MAVAIGMAIICSTKGIAHPAWENIVLPFSSDPALIKLQYPTSAHEWAATKAYNQSHTASKDGSIYNNNALGNTFDPTQAGRELTPYEKVQVLLRMDWGMSTNFVGALDLLAMRAIQAGVKMPRVLVVLLPVSMSDRFYFLIGLPSRLVLRGIRTLYSTETHALVMLQPICLPMPLSL